jgi:hypothetical protein
MRDPHVVALFYRLIEGQQITFDSPPPIEDATDEFRVRLADNEVTVEFLSHYSDVPSARRTAEGYLEAWEIKAQLEAGHPVMQFEFVRPEVIDRNPPLPGEPQTLSVGPAELVLVANDVSFHITQREYPAPPRYFAVSLDLETMWLRYRGYCQGRERLADMAYACLTVLERSTNGRAQAAKRYAISSGIFGTLARLCTEIGDEQTARKFSRLKERRAHTDVEVRWLEEAVKVMIKRLGEWNADPAGQLPQITMSSLPAL